MDINELKSLIKTSTAVLVLDNGEPAYVVLGYKTYKELTAEKGGEKEIKINHASAGNGNGEVYGHDREAEMIERLNKEISALKSQIETEERGLHTLGVDE